MSRILALDYGERRIGLAVSDPTRTIAQPLPTILRRRGRRPPYTKIIEAIEEWGVETVVLGLPVEMNGEEGPPARTVRDFGQGLERRAHCQGYVFYSRSVEVLTHPEEVGEGEPRSLGRHPSGRRSCILRLYG